MTTKIEAQLNGEQVVLEVSGATVLTAMKRAIWRGRAQAEVEQLQSADLPDSTLITALMFVSMYAYPDCLAATTHAEGLDIAEMKLSDFAALPEEFVDTWLLGVYKACPHWEPRSTRTDESTAEAEAAEKKD